MDNKSEITSITKCENVVSTLDLLDLDESLIDKKLDELLTKKDITIKNLNIILSFLKYKYLISLQEETECDCEAYIEYAVNQLNNVTNVKDEEVVVLLNIFSTALLLHDKEKLQQYIEHMIQQYLSSVHAEIGSDYEENSRIPILLKIIDCLLDLSAENKLKINSRFINIELQVVLQNQEKFTTTDLFSKIIPKIIKSSKDYYALSLIWENIVSHMDNVSVNDFIILGSLSDFYFPLETNETFKSTLVNNEEFWKFVQRGFLNNDYQTRKCSMYLAKRAVQYTTQREKKYSVIFKHDSKPVFEWSREKKIEIETGWNNLFVLLETLEEKQSHLVRSALHLLENLSDLHFSWYCCALQRTMQHENDAIKIIAIQHTLKCCPTSENCKYFPYKGLLKTLNNTFLYDECGNVGKNYLMLSMKSFLEHRNNFTSVLKNMALINWSPIPRIYISCAFLECKSTGRFNFDLETIRAAFSCKNIALPNNHLMRHGLRNCLVDCVMRFVSTLVNVNDLIELFSAFNVKEHICHSEFFWKNVRCWIENMDILEGNFLNEIYLKLENGLIENRQDFKYIARLTKLLTNAKNEERLMKTLKNMFVTLEQSNSREYASRRELDTCYFFIMNILILDDPVFRLKNRNVNTFIVENGFEAIFLYLQRCLRTTVDMEDYDLINAYLDPLNIFLSKTEYSPYLLRCNKQIISLSHLVVSKGDGSNLQILFAAKIISLMALFFHCEHCSPNPNDCELRKHFEVLKDEPKLYFSKEENITENNALKGKIASDYCEAQSSVYFQHFSIHGIDKNASFILQKIERFLEIGGYQCLKWVTKLCHILLPKIDSEKDENCMFVIIKRLWNEIFEIRKNEKFKECIKEFIYMLFQENTLHPKWTDVQKCYIDEIFVFAEQSPLILTVLMKRIQSIEQYHRMHLAYIIEKVLLVGAVPRKDQRIEIQTYNFIKETHGIKVDSSFNPVIESRALALNALISMNNEVHNEIYKNLTARYKNEWKGKYHGNSLYHRVFLRTLQGQLFLSKLFPDANLSGENVRWCVQHLIKQPHHISSRIMLEWQIILYLIQRKPVLNKETIKDLELQNLPQISHFTIIFHVVKTQIDFYKKHNLKYQNGSPCLSFVNKEILSQNFHAAVNTYLPHIMGQIFNVRLHAQYLTLKLCQMMSFMTLTTKYDIICETIQKTFEMSANEKNLKSIQNDFYINNFDAVINQSAKDIYYSVPRLTNLASDEWLDLKSLESTDQRMQHPLLQLCRKLSEGFDLSKLMPKHVEKDDPLPENEVQSLNVQKKFIPWQAMLSQIGISLNDSTVKDNQKTSGNSLIVVASLIDRLPNLGGLVRTCEIFGVHQYVIDNIKVLQDLQFQNLSVSAERWINILEMKRGTNLKTYLTDMKSQGYSIVGAEQTSSSVSLNDFEFPEKSILLLGHEKEGIPCDLLTLLDHCVEIPQYGVIRSLNVHVSASLFIWQYRKQYPIL